MRPKVIFVAPPFCGHLHPVLGLADGARDVADVWVASTHSGIQQAERCGLPGLELLRGRERILWEIAEPGQDVRNNPLRLMRQVQANVGLLAQIREELLGICKEIKPDLLLSDFTVAVAGVAARESGVRWWTSVPSPCVIEAPDGPPAYFGGMVPARNLPEACAHALLRLAVRCFKRTVHRIFRKRLCALGFPSIYRRDGSEAVYSDELVLGLTPEEIEFPRRMPRHFHSIGPVLFTPPCRARPPVFGPQAKRYVLVTLGTHLPHRKAACLDAVRRCAAEFNDWEFHFTHGKESEERALQEANVREFAYISYAENLARYDFVVHHGGSGIMNHCLSLGKPAVVLPLDYDQFDQAARLEVAGVAVRIRKFDEMASALRRVAGDSFLAERCREVARSVSSQDAVGWVRDRIEQLALPREVEGRAQ